MNEEISRILKLLEDGKITADAAERLIRAVRDRSGNGTSEHRWSTAGRTEPPDILRGLVRSLKAAGRRHRRLTWWRFYRFQEQMAACRRRRADEMTPRARVEYLFTHRGLAEPDELRPEVSLSDLGLDQVGKDVLRWALQDEFGVELAPEVFGSLTTYGAVVAWAESLTTPPTAPDAAASAPSEPVSAPEPPTDPEMPQEPEPLA